MEVLKLASASFAPYSLHDACVKISNIKSSADELKFSFEYIFGYFNDGEKTYAANLVLKGCDIDMCDIYLFKNIPKIGRNFSGKKLDFAEFLQDFKDCELEILDFISNGFCVTIKSLLKIDENFTSECWLFLSAKEISLVVGYEF